MAPEEGFELKVQDPYRYSKSPLAVERKIAYARVYFETDSIRMRK